MSVSDANASTPSSPPSTTPEPTWAWTSAAVLEDLQDLAVHASPSVPTGIAIKAQVVGGINQSNLTASGRAAQSPDLATSLVHANIVADPDLAVQLTDHFLSTQRQVQQTAKTLPLVRVDLDQLQTELSHIQSLLHASRDD
ncbi:hypothetical protein H4R34_000551 [Dimargaris verticillata]|uniref:Uncharacterized protein n=1 Tax=Dimargaris verticillata TaxID=2761393 RepID=A0A9W8BA49_9FUNG|nr:hypothetical protein H4R34_000551 [Dimargaris verticillata]